MKKIVFVTMRYKDLLVILGQILKFCYRIEDTITDFLLGISTVKELKLCDMQLIDEKHLSNSRMYQATPYKILKKIKNFLYTKEIDWNDSSLVDIGCGRGRTLVYLSKLGFKKMIGVEFAKDLCLSANHNINRSKKNVDFEVICCDISDYHFEDNVKVIYLYNPADVILLEKVVGRITKMNNIPMVIYVNPLRGHLFLSNGFRMTHEIPSLNLNYKVQIYEYYLRST